ncbi:MAG: hypothetical protein CHACPFDD_00557 [Phycisphaerae bacterium]|nr:hypothetical protein [Phycisphaerae bacterium]
MNRLQSAASSFALLLLPLLVSCQASAPRAGSAPPANATAASHEPIRVGAWNIEWLGTPESRSGPAKGVAQTADDLAEYIAAARVDILGLEEIGASEHTDPPTSDTLTAAFQTVSQRGGGAWRHRLFPARSGRNQLCGVAWNERRVTPVGGPRVATEPSAQSAQGKPLWSRPPWGQTFSAGDGLSDFVVVVVHMKSDYGGDFAEHRAGEAATLTRDLRSAFTDGDLLIIGDANCDTHSEPAVAALEQAGFVDLNRADTATHLRYGALDRAFVPAAQPEFAACSFEVLSDVFLQQRGLTKDDFKRRFSDHFMVITTVAVMPDDD